MGIIYKRLLICLIQYLSWVVNLSTQNFNKDSNFIQGYYTHLITDASWLKGFYLPRLKNRMEADENIFNRYHNDFLLLNIKLLDYNASQQLSGALSISGTIIETEEVKSNDIKECFPFVLGDTLW